MSEDIHVQYTLPQTPSASHSCSAGPSQNDETHMNHHSKEQHTERVELARGVKPKHVESASNHKADLDVHGHVLLSVYLIIAAGILACIIYAAISDDRDMYTLTFTIILLSTLLSTVLSGLALIKYGRINDHVDRLKEENRIYRYEIDELTETRGKLNNHVTDLQQQVLGLQQHCTNLDEQQLEFGDLIDELKHVAGEDNMQRILQQVDQVNFTFARMNDLVYQNKKLHLLAVYYDTAFRDEDDRMNAEEYRRFLLRIDKQLRRKFDELGPFAEICGDDGFIDLETFLEILERVLQGSMDVIQQEFKREYSRHHRLYSRRRLNTLDL